MKNVITEQTSESLELGMLLALSGGLMDAYSYICRDHVFANAQTGNILLLGIHLSECNWRISIQYIFPIAAFTLGIIIANLFRLHFQNKCFFHWRQLSLFTEVLFLCIVCFIPQKFNLIANSLTSLACGIQAESFRKLHGNSIATTMCIGNLRSGTQYFCEFLHSHQKKYANKAIIYYSVILFFSIGAIIGNILIKYFHEKAIMGSVFLLSVSFIFMFQELTISHIAKLYHKICPESE